MNLFIGDSHILCLQEYKSTNNNLFEFSASSIRGLMNKDSISGTRNRILELVYNNNYNNLFIMFGKVDIEWVFPYKKNINIDLDINIFIKETIDKYILFINELEPYFNNIYIMGLHLPSLDSNEMLKCINSYSAIKDVSTKANIIENINTIHNIDSLYDRTKQIIYFNYLLKNEIINQYKNKYYYIDITDDLLDSKTNICNKYFIDSNDHHLNRCKTGQVWFNKHLQYIISNT